MGNIRDTYFISVIKRLQTKHVITYPKERLMALFCVDGQLSCLLVANKMKKDTTFRYSFRFPELLVGNKEVKDQIVWFYLLFLDKPAVPLYRLAASQVAHIRTSITLRDSNKTTYTLMLVGYLGNPGNRKPLEERKGKTYRDSNTGKFTLRGGEKK